MDLGTQHTLDHILILEYLTDAAYLVFGPVLGLDERVDLGLSEYLPGTRATDPKDGSQRKFPALLRWYVYSCNSWHNFRVFGRYPCRCLCFGFFLLMM